MQIDQSLIYIVILIFTVLVLFLVGILYAYLKLVRNYLDVKEGRDRYPDPKALLLRAHAKAQKLIEDATEKASQIISSSETLKSKNLEDVQKQIEKAQIDSLKIYQNSVSKIQEDSLKVLQNVPEYIKALLSKEVLVVKDDLLDEIKIAHENAKKLITQAYQKADSEVADYKRVRMDALDKTIISMVQKISRKVLNKEIEPTEHEKLVLKALEEAKRQNIFSEFDETDKNDRSEKSDVLDNQNE
jgi:hypothetical protein